MTNQLKILFLAANPQQTTRLQLNEEARAISAAIRDGCDRDLLDFKTEWAVRTSDLQQVILQYKPQILHFSGHGSKSPGLTMGDESGNAVHVNAAAIAAVVRAAAPLIRMVILNACTTLPVISHFQDAVDYTIGMERPISDEAAIWFSAAFYGALAAGTSVEKAFEWGIARLETEGSQEADIPRLLKRAGLSDPGVLLPPSAPTPAPPAQPPVSPAPAPHTGTTINAGSVGSVNTVHGDNAFLYQPRER